MSENPELEKIISYKFKNEAFLKEALTHRSYVNENPSWKYGNNERLEFLGDAALELAVTECLFEEKKDAQEGELTVFRAALVNTQMLSRIADEINLHKFIFLSKGEIIDNSKAREGILADMMEALIGALYKDGGYEKAKQFIVKFIMPHLSEVIEKKLYKDPKSLLQEIVQEKLRLTPTYKILEESGPDHEKTFRVGVYFNGTLQAEGVGSSKQEAELKAAEAVLNVFKTS
ncbi:MAG: ribonuclease III [Candidatus Colwellbacteria bacterium RIFCSPLOWO2_12_FULL_44_13]|uniref:Ribonuclease 3 n=1 Tax=Candidatus Colwellbacteria bacterium RIFCSPLOWO2_12_FULL_44_13 TaxID=1797694 RepID=A0A1G1ZAV9_9BACT|nr:MAG: ribonuclease III [Candidatus Colwellbacteria bacterium RIFCSPLOWO2_12_FULL_44_13]